VSDISSTNEARSAARAEASAWIARLNGPQRSAAAERAFRNWLAKDPLHEQEFSKATEVWQSIRGAAAALDLDYGPKSKGPRFKWAVAAAVIALAIGLVYWLMPRDYSTASGEQKSLLLVDGTRVTLNTATRVSVDYTQEARRIRLDSGEAFFEVNSDPQRPFIVAAGNRRIRALGTSFVVRNDANGVVVTLVQGKVEVSSLEAEFPVHPALLTPGQRLIASKEGEPRIDTPDLDAVTAWRRGEVVFDDVSLAAAAEELNRYGGTHIAVVDPDVAQLRISGVFAATDPLQFAQAIARIHHLRTRIRDKELVLQK